MRFRLSNQARAGTYRGNVFPGGSPGAFRHLTFDPRAARTITYDPQTGGTPSVQKTVAYGTVKKGRAVVQRIMLTNAGVLPLAGSIQASGRGFAPVSSASSRARKRTSRFASSLPT